MVKGSSLVRDVIYRIRNDHSVEKREGKRCSQAYVIALLSNAAQEGEYDIVVFQTMTMHHLYTNGRLHLNM